MAYTITGWNDRLNNTKRNDVATVEDEHLRMRHLRMAICGRKFEDGTFEDGTFEEQRWDMFFRP
jgi:hypothetical protein